MTASPSGHALAQAQFDEIDQDDRVSNDDAAAGHEADHAGGAEEGAHQAVGRQDADERERDGDHDDGRGDEAAEPADHQHIDQHQAGGEGAAEIAEHLDGDVPLAIPFQGGFVRR